MGVWGNMEYFFGEKDDWKEAIETQRKHKLVQKMTGKTKQLTEALLKFLEENNTDEKRKAAKDKVENEYNQIWRSGLKPDERKKALDRLYQTYCGDNTIEQDL